MARTRRVMTFKIPDDAEALLRAYAEAVDKPMSDVVVSLLRSLKACLARRQEREAQQR